MKQETYVSWNLLCCVRKCCATSDDIVMFFIDSNGKNTTNCLKYVSLMCTELQICKHVLHSSLFSSSISICEQKLKYWAAKCNIQSFDNPIHNPPQYTILYVRSHSLPTLFVGKTTLVHQLPTLHAVCAFTLYRDGVFSYMQCSWILQERFEPRIAFITCSNNIWQPFFGSPEKLLCMDYCCFHNEPFN